LYSKHSRLSFNLFFVCAREFVEATELALCRHATRQLGSCTLLESLGVVNYQLNGVFARQLV
jgi:hypothetical protein